MLQGAANIQKDSHEHSNMSVETEAVDFSGCRQSQELSFNGMFNSQTKQPANLPSLAITEPQTTDRQTDIDARKKDAGVVKEEASESEEMSGKERRRRQKLANKEGLLCAVCGDKANGYNFGAITCESCKAFFRRNALKNKDLRCNFEDNCTIDHFTRKFCTTCRLKKCFAVNMHKEWILDEDALKKRKKLTRRSKDESNETAHAVSMMADSTRLISTDSNSSNSGPIEEDQDMPPIPLSEEDEREILKIMEDHSMIDLPIRHKGAAAESSGAAVYDMSSMSGMMPGMMGDMMGGAMGSMFNHPLAQQQQQQPKIEKKDMNDRGYSIDCTEFNKLTDDPGRPEDVLNMADGFIQRLIKFVKTLPEFKALSKDDQVQLLKGGIMETLVLRSAIQYDPKVGGFAVQDINSKEKKYLKISFISQGLGEELFTEHMRFIESFNAAAKWDKPTMVLAMIINLFSRDRPGLTNKKVVENAEGRYSMLLQAYMRSKYSFHEASTLYPKLLLKLTDVRSYGEMSAQHVAQVAPQDMEPLLKDIFSMH